MTHETVTTAREDARQTLPVRLGVIDYLNCVPVYDWLLGQMARDGLPSIETVAGTPAQMNQALLAGEIDISNVSSVAFGEHADEWLLIPRLSVAAHGAVESVLLFSWQDDWRALDGRSIALTDHSATSVALVRLLSERRYGIQPRYVTQPPDLDAMLAEHDAALLIGDIALRSGDRVAGVDGATVLFLRLGGPGRAGGGYCRQRGGAAAARLASSWYRRSGSAGARGCGAAQSAGGGLRALPAVAGL
jgi:predicted solute-binding protein